MRADDNTRSNLMLNRLQACFVASRVLYTRHARNKMRLEELGPIYEQEVFEAVQSVRSYKTTLTMSHIPACSFTGARP